MDSRMEVNDAKVMATLNAYFSDKRKVADVTDHHDSSEEEFSDAEDVSTASAPPGHESYPPPSPSQASR